MDYDLWVSAIRSNIDRLADAADEAGVDARVPSCPEWTVADLLEHVGQAQRRWAWLVAIRSTDPPDFRSRTDAPDGEALVEWARFGGHELAEVLAATPPDTSVWTWTGTGTARFWARRQAHETVVHRCDAELANGEIGALDPDLAADGIDEFFELLLMVPAASAIRGNGETVHVHCTDRDVEWLAELTPEGLRARREHTKAQVAVRGPAAALFLALWNRIGYDNPELEVFGDHTLLDRWRRIATI